MCKRKITLKRDTEPSIKKNQKKGVFLGQDEMDKQWYAQNLMVWNYHHTFSS